MRLFLGAVFLISILGINQCVGLSEEEYPCESCIITDDNVAYHVDEFWGFEEIEISEIISNVFKCPEIRAHDINVKAELSYYGVPEWLQDLLLIASLNENMAFYWNTASLSWFMDDQVNYMANINRKLNATTINDLREIVSFASQFKFPLEKSFFNVYGSQKPYADYMSVWATRYSGLLHKYKNQLKNLNSEQLKNLNELLKPVDSKLKALDKKAMEIHVNNYAALEKFRHATREIHKAMEYIDEGGELSKNEGIIKQNIEICKNEMKNPSLKKTIKNTLDKYKPIFDEIVVIQKNVMADIEEVLKTASNNSKIVARKSKIIRK